MSASIGYKNKRILECGSAMLECLKENLLFFAQKKKLDPNSNLIQFIESLEYSQSWNIETDLNSKAEIELLADLAKLAIPRLEKEVTPKYWEGDIDNKITSTKTIMLNFQKSLEEIAENEWVDDNLLIGRAYLIRPLRSNILFYAYTKGIHRYYTLMPFIDSLWDKLAYKYNVDVHNKEDLKKFIELLEPAANDLIEDGYYDDQKIERDGKIINYGENKILNYIKRLKEVVETWDTSISDNWKRVKSTNAEKYEPYRIRVHWLVKRIFKLILLITIAFGFYKMAQFISSTLEEIEQKQFKKHSTNR